MVGAMQSVLTTAGINQTSVRTEEFDGFAMNHPESTHKPYWKRHLPLVIGALAILAMVIVHTSAGISMSHANLSTFSLNNPISYLTIGLLLALIGFKVTVGVKIKRALTSEQGRLSFKAALKAHKPKKK
jgi:uncharacterized membrane protein